ncbi:glycoside hydrolase family 5 protein [Tabrizicola thermarum]|uniref:glycoside hydrolase family 5 protein n=1 Tax=Tabrizicola thermarum TaxID=2670345 RepID=UPI000FFB4131|nr:cellulase family glycosylhydrolase [Tabrizicola thermarum]
MLRAVLILALILPGAALAEPISLKRGVNLGLWNDWLSLGEMLARPETLAPFPDWRRDVTPAMLSALAKQGFDHVRMPTDPGPLLAYGPGVNQDRLIAEIRAATELSLEASLKVVVDLHPVNRGEETGGIEDILDSLWPDYVALVGRLAADLATLPADRVALELLNEPTFDCEAVYAGAPPRWPAMQAELLAAVRARAPDLTVVLTGACWGQANALAALNPADFADDNVLWTFHSYEPFLFSHQGASWSGAPEKYVWNLPYPPSAVTDDQAAGIAAAAKEAMAAAEGATDDALIDKAIADYRAYPDSIVTTEIDRAIAWADGHGIPRDRLYLGEFGALHTNTQGETYPRDWYLAFLADKRAAAEAAGLSWAVLSHVGGMGIASEDAPDRRLDRDTCRALGLPCGN